MRRSSSASAQSMARSRAIFARSNRIRMRARFCRSASGTWVRTLRSSTCTAWGGPYRVPERRRLTNACGRPTSQSSNLHTQICHLPGGRLMRGVRRQRGAMKYKVLKSAAHNFGRSFASSLNWRGNDYVMSHLARAVVASGEVELSVDLLSGEAKPTPLLEGPVQSSVTDYVRWFPDLLRSQRVVPEAVRTATMRVRFQPERRGEVHGGVGGGARPFWCVVGRAA